MAVDDRSRERVTLVPRCSRNATYVGLMIEQEIAASDRSSFLARLGALHDGALVTLRVDERNEVVGQELRGLSTDGGDVIVSTGDGIRHAHHGHRVLQVRRVRLEQTDEGADAAIALTSDDGTRTEIVFRSPMRADLLDPAVE
jgi:hypothetical protein